MQARRLPTDPPGTFRHVTTGDPLIDTLERGIEDQSMRAAILELEAHAEDLHGNAGDAYSVPLGFAIHDLTLDHASCTLSLPAVAGERTVLVLRQGSGGNKAVIWPDETRFAGGTAPVLSTNAGDVDVIDLVSIAGDQQVDWVASLRAKGAAFAT